MKKLLTLLLMLLCLHSCIKASVFENDVIKFIYPEGYDEAKIENAPL